MTAAPNWKAVFLVCAVLVVLGLVGGRAATIAKWLGIGLLAIFALDHVSAWIPKITSK